MPDLVYPREKTLGWITLILGLLAWLLIVVGTFGFALVYLLFGFIFYVFAHSGLIAWLRGTGVRLSDEQFPELYLQYLQCCKKLNLVDPPEAYILQGDGIMNAFATRFLGRNFVIVLSDTVDAMRSQPDGINFYFGHELGHNMSLEHANALVAYRENPHTDARESAVRSAKLLARAPTPTIARSTAVLRRTIPVVRIRF